jgi:hypothetical protein
MSDPENQFPARVLPLDSQNSYGIEFADGTRFYAWNRGGFIELGITSAPSSAGTRYTRRARCDRATTSSIATALNRLAEKLEE